MPADLNAHPIPPEYAWHLNLFTTLNKCRDSGGIPYSEIESYCRLYQMTLDLEEISILSLLDNLYMEHEHKKALAEQKKQKLKEASGT